MAASQLLILSDPTDMNPDTEVAIRAHAIAEYPRECCGLIVLEAGVEVYVPCRNVATGKKNGRDIRQEQFRLAQEDYFAAADRGDVLALVHSHPDEPARPTQGDRVCCEESQIPWYIVRVDGTEGEIVTREIESLAPCGYQAPLIGREFYHGVLDCYALIRDWFQIERGIVIPDFARRDNWWADGSGDDLYMTQFRKAGFVQVDLEDLQVGDCFIMQVRAKVANHAAVYIGNNMILHHLYGRPSRRDVYGVGGYWHEVTRLVVRYSGQG
ncbi:C40 family peptidase [Herbaspirillum sp. NPDC101396]|uniref:C40 family peptidase n=1 Tax=Herbaspirillum sp. NPDC101396 TaxID=3364005 RepID=UPI00383B11C5